MVSYHPPSKIDAEIANTSTLFKGIITKGLRFNRSLNSLQIWLFIAAEATGVKVLYGSTS